MICSKLAFCVLDAGYVDPAIVSINSFLKFNRNIPLVIYAETGTNTARIMDAIGTGSQNVRIITENFPDVTPEELGKENPYFDLFVNRKSLPAFAQRIKAIDDLRKYADLLINFDLDTIFINTVEKLVNNEGIDNRFIYGVSERKNRDRWMRQLNTREIINNENYVNSGFLVIGSEASREINLKNYVKFLNRFPNDIYCPEQDFINYICAGNIVRIPEAFNLMFTSEEYQTTSPVMIHYLSKSKPWTAEPIPAGVGYYFKRYLVEAEKNQSFLSSNFLKSIKNNVEKLNL